MVNRRIGVIGAGTMGSGIALAALLADHQVVLYDLVEAGLERAQEYIRKHLERKHRAISIKYLTLTSNLQDLRGCGFVIEAAPEVLDLKEKLFAELSQICPPPAILATNTSTLPVTAIGAAVEAPERFGGMHFFNPAPVMPLVEIIRGAATAPETAEALANLAVALGKTPVLVRDTPGFIVNRVARPFYGEALRLVGEGAAALWQVDRLVRLGAGFRMGPFELMDLIGIDINFAATQSMYEQTFGEPRYRPHLLQAQLVQQKAFGRKTGRGFYRYNERGEIEAEANQPVGHPGRAETPGTPAVLLSGDWAPGLEAACRDAGISVLAEPEDQPAWLGVAAAGKSAGLRQILQAYEQALPDGTPILCQCADVTLGEAAGWLRQPARLVGFDGLFAAGQAVSLVAHLQAGAEVRTRVEAFFGRLGKEAVWVEDTPGLVLPRIICMLANEAAFAVSEGAAGPETIDQAMQLGTNYPKGPLGWAKEIGYDRVLAVLDHLHAEYKEERYRAAPLLRRWQRYSHTASE
jgi:3-hydroxybutyryl-CoA dehydrogenase